MDAPPPTMYAHSELVAASVCIGGELDALYCRQLLSHVILVGSNHHSGRQSFMSCQTPYNAIEWNQLIMAFTAQYTSTAIFTNA